MARSRPPKQVVGELGRIAQGGDRFLDELDPHDRPQPDDGVAGELDCDRPVRPQAGAVSRAGYRAISLDGRGYRAGRLAWFWMTGTWPKNDVDHKNLNPDDNRWDNLREATRSQNIANQRGPSGTATGIKGVYPYKDRYRARIKKDRKLYHLGVFDTPEAAHAAYVEAAKRLHGEPARHPR
jgi:hypothetical protein